MQSKEIFNLLTNEYTLILATTKEDFSSVKEVRKNVLLPKYQNFTAIENEELFLFNDDDIQSFIYLLQDKKKQQYVGVVRVFFINKYTPIQQLPMQRYGHVGNIKHLTKELPIAEISRGALIKNLTLNNHLSALELRTILTFYLMITTRINMFLYNYKHIFSIMETSLHRILKRQDVNFKQIGKAVNYYGIRTPYAIETKKLLKETEHNMGKLTRHYLKQLCQNPEPFWQFIDNNPYLERSDIQLDRICQLFKEYGDDVDLELLLGEKEIITEV